MSFTSKANEVLEAAKQAATHVQAWADFSTLLFDQEGGAVAAAFPDEAERQAFFDSEQYKEINQILLGLMKSTGLRRGSKPAISEKSGRFNVRVPKTLHQYLEIESKREKISLNQLALTKLSIPLSASLTSDKSLVARAYVDVYDGYAIDRIVVDPDYNPKFIRRCRELGLDRSPLDLNHCLMGLRKSKTQREKLGIVLPPTSKETAFHDFDDYQFAAEIAVRVLQRTDGVTLDRILCDPDMALRFDEIALGLVNQTRLKLRWAALNLRKTRRLRPIKDMPASYDLVTKGQLTLFDVETLTDDPGLYVIYDQQRPLFAGETDRLRHRIQLHRQYGIPFIDIKHDDGVALKTFTAPGAKQSERAKWLMAFINAERPLLNYQMDSAA